jgi:SAM-dependent methyltransferase
MTDRPDYWNRIYEDEGRPGWDMAKATPVLGEALAHAVAAGLAPGASVVVPGCGYGHDAAELAALGYAVTGLDFAPLALQGARARYGDRIVWSPADWFSPWPGPWDAIFDHTCFVTMDPARRPAYVDACARHLAAGGLWMAILFHDVQGRPGPPHAISMEACRSLAEPRFEILHLAHATTSHPRRLGREFLLVARRRQD